MKKALLIHPEELTKKWIDRMSDVGCTALAFHPEGGINAEKSLGKLIELCKTDKFRQLVDYANDKKMQIEYHMHSARYLLPESYFNEHPEWFRENENKEHVPDFNFCISNREALEFVSENAVKLAKALYKSDAKFYFWLDDKKGARCFCKKCSCFSASDLNLIVVNEIVTKLRKEIKDAKLCYLAYYDSMPVPEKVKPCEEIFLQYAPFERDFKKGAVCMSDNEKQNITDLLEFFGDTDSEVLEYWYDNSMYSGWKKPPKKLVTDNEMIKNDIDFYKNLGFSKIASFACFLGEDYEELYGEPDVSAFTLN